MKKNTQKSYISYSAYLHLFLTLLYNCSMLYGSEKKEPKTSTVGVSLASPTSNSSSLTLASSTPEASTSGTNSDTPTPADSPATPTQPTIGTSVSTPAKNVTQAIPTKIVKVQPSPTPAASPAGSTQTTKTATSIPEPASTESTTLTQTKQTKTAAVQPTATDSPKESTQPTIATPIAAVSTPATTTSGSTLAPLESAKRLQILVSVYIQNNYPEDAILNSLDIMVANKTTPITKNNLNLPIPAAKNIYTKGLITAFDIMSDQNNIQTFNDVENITINGNKIIIHNMKIGYTLQNPIIITKKNGIWCLDI